MGIVAWNNGHEEKEPKKSLRVSPSCEFSFEIWRIVGMRWYVQIERRFDHSGCRHWTPLYWFGPRHQNFGAESFVQLAIALSLMLEAPCLRTFTE
jgi:hypothetical protein